MNLYQPTISGSLTVSGSVEIIGPFTMSGGSITGTASFAQNSGLLSNLDSGSFVGTGSFNSMSSSVSTRVTNIEGNYATTGSNIFLGAQTVCANITSTGTIIAQTINVQSVTSSVVYSSGSNVFGNDLSNSQTFTGSMLITGSMRVIGNACATGTGCFGVVCSPSYIGGTVSGTTVYGSTVVCGASICATGNSCFGNDVFVYGDLRMQGTDSFIWSPSGCLNGYTGFYDGYNDQIALKICNNSGHVILQLTRCNVGVGVANPGQKLEVAGVIQSYDRTNGAVDGAFYASKCGGTTSVIIRSCGNTYFNGGNVGIGTDTPTKKLQICTTAAAENVLTITNGTQILHLGVNDSATGSYLFEQSANSLRFGTSDAERMRFTSTGTACFACQICAPNLRIQSAFANLTLCGSNTTAPHIGGTFIIDTNQDGNGRTIIGNATVGRAMYLEANGAITFNCNTSVNALLSVNSSCIIVTRGDGNPALLQLGNTSNAYQIQFTCTGGNGQRIAFINGAPTEYASFFGATGVACFLGVVCAPSGIRFASGGSTLSNYETGTWTPFVSRLSSVPTVSYSSREGSYTRIGNMVYVFWDMTVSSLTGGSGVAIICNLPITVSSGMAGYSKAQHRDASLIAASGGTVLNGFAEKGNNYVYLQYDYTGACGFCTVPGSGGNAVFNSSGRMTGYVIYQV